MTLHYHGTPITPRARLLDLSGHCFCVSYKRPEDVEVCHRIGQSVMLDNGAFSFWRSGKSVKDWSGYYAWVERWLVYQSTWAVIPDVITGMLRENDALLEQWPFGERGAPVWHMHEPIDRLLRLASFWPKVCIGSSGSYVTVGTVKWHHRMTESMNRLCGNGPSLVWLHMLRGMNMSTGHYPFASVDSTDLARNHYRRRRHIKEMALSWDSLQCPGIWIKRPFQKSLFVTRT